MPKKSKDRTDGQENVSLQMERIWRPVFDNYDLNKDGKIALDDIKRFLREGNSHLDEDFSKEVLDEMVERADWDNNRVLTFEEFLRMVHTQELGAQTPRLHRLIRYAALAVVPRNERQSVIRKYIEEYNCAPPPLFLPIISIIELAVFIYYCVDMGECTAIGPVPFDSGLIYNPSKRYEAWRYITYMLIHAGYFHIFFNLLIQLILGIPLEMVHKWWRIGLVYLAGGLAGSLGASISDPFSFLAGASGGVYALITAYLAEVMMNWEEMEFGWIRLISLLIFGGTDIGVAVYDRHWAKSVNRTSYAAHLSGAIAGLLVGVIALRNLKVRKWETLVGWMALVLYILLMGFAIIWNVANSEYYPSPK